MARTGRPTKLTPDVQDRIVMAIRAGNYIETAAAYAGINKDTLYDWLRRGARAKRRTIFKDFSDAVEKALAESEVADVALIAKAASKNWQAAAWRLERKNPRRWGRRQTLEVAPEQDSSGKPKLPEIRIELVRPAPNEKGELVQPRVRFIPHRDAPSNGGPSNGGPETNGHSGNGGPNGTGQD